MPPRKATVLVLFLLSVACPLLADDFKPSPKETFTIATRSKDDGEGGKNWTTSIVFPEGGAPETFLSTEEDEVMYPGVFEISPDDRWILRIQKVVSGQNTAILYRVEENQRVTRMVQPLEDFAWQAVADAREIPKSALSQMAVEFVGWDLKAGELVFRIIGFTKGENDEDISQMVSYHLGKNTYRLVK